MKKTQKEIVLEHMRRHGEISNLWAIQHGIWRLGAIIFELRSEGYTIETEFNTERVGKNTHYKLAKKTLF